MTPLYLAPMAGFTDLSVRKMFQSRGADFTVTEMVSAKALCFDDEKSLKLIENSPVCTPFSVQIFGNEPEIMARGARKAFEFSKCDAIDINMGCPVKKVFGNGEGSALMKSPGLIYDVVRAVKTAVPCAVSVKLRAGVDSAHLNAAECAAAAEEAGCDFITVHARTRTQMYAPPVLPQVITEVKRTVKCPVFGNGDVTDGESAKKMLEETGCDGLAIGRGALSNPFVFEEIKAYLDGKIIAFSLADRVEAQREQLHDMVRLKGEYVGCREARALLAWYIKGVRGASKLRLKAGLVSTLADIDAVLDGILKAGE